MYSNANPGGIGHQFYLRHFINNTNAGVSFIPATYKDNCFLDANYVKSLEGLTRWRRRAWLEGDWNIHAGTYFTNFTAKHVVEPYEIYNLGWTFYIAVDYGYTHPTAFLLMAQDNKKDIYFIDGYAASKRHPEAHHRMVLEMLAKWNLRPESIRAFVMGTDSWKPNEKGVTVADSYEALGWRPEPANMSRVSGAAELSRKLGDEEAGIAPTLWFFNTARGLIDQLPTMQHDPHRPEDVLKVNVDDEGYGGDDWYDAARYGVMLLADSREVSFGTIWVPR